MEIDFYVQSQAFMYSLLLGAALGILYGAFKFIRTAFLSTKPAVIISDIAFMIVASLALFFYSLAMLYGYVRIYVVFGALCGFAAYRFSLGKLISRIYCPIINALNVANKKIRTKFKKITEKLLKIGNNILYNIGKKIDTFRNKQKGLSVRKRLRRVMKTKKRKPQINPESNAETATIKEIEPKKKKRGRYILLYLAIIGFAFYAVITIVNQNIQIADKKAELDEINKQINVVEIQIKYLDKVKSYSGEQLKEYIEKIAKNEMGYVSEGERIFYNVSGE